MLRPSFIDFKYDIKYNHTFLYGMEIKNIRYGPPKDFFRVKHF